MQCGHVLNVRPRAKLVDNLKPLLEGIDQGELFIRQKNGKRYSRKSASGTDIHNCFCLPAFVETAADHRINEVLDHKFVVLCDARQIDLFVPC